MFILFVHQDNTELTFEIYVNIFFAIIIHTICHFFQNVCLIYTLQFTKNICNEDFEICKNKLFNRFLMLYKWLFISTFFAT